MRVSPKSLSRVRLFTTVWTVALQLLCSWDSPDKNSEVGCHAPPPGDPPDPGVETSFMSPALAGGFFTT